MQDNQQNAHSLHYKMYKSGCKWVFAGVAALTLITTTNAVAQADSTTPNQPSTDRQGTNAQPNEHTDLTAPASQQAQVTFMAQASAASAAPTSAAPVATSAPATNAAAQPAPKAEQAVVSVTNQASDQQKLANLHFSNNQQNQAFIQSVAGGAINGWNQYQVLPSVTVAQAILESGWGQSTLSTEAHNLFGIKGSYNGNYVTMSTREVNAAGSSYYVNAAFRAYANNGESVEDHGNFLYTNSRYHNLLGDTNANSVVHKLQADGYATDPNYANALINLIQTYNLTQIDQLAIAGFQPVITNPNDPQRNDQGQAGSDTGYYTVQSGDTLSGIAARFNSTANHLASLNGIANPNLIYVGQRLLVQDQTPAPSTTPTSDPAQPAASGPDTYTVQAGDTLSGIAGAFHTSTAALTNLNQLANPNLIYVGQVLKVKASANPTPATPATPAPAAPAAPTTTGSATYTVQAGDTLSGIASQYQTTVAALATTNGIANPNRIYVGQVLHLGDGANNSATPTRPAATNGNGYTVQAGDTLSGIAAQFGLNWHTLAATNGIASPYTIYVGQRLVF